MQSRGKHVQAGDVIPYVMCKVNSYTESHFDVFHIARHFHDVLTEPLKGTTASAPTPSGRLAQPMVPALHEGNQ